MTDASDGDALAFGTVQSSQERAAMAALLAAYGVTATTRDSSHYAGGQYVLVADGDVRVTLERTSDLEYLLRGDAPAVTPLVTLCTRLSASLRAAGVPHGIEVYDADERLVCTPPPADDAPTAT